MLSGVMSLEADARHLGAVVMTRDAVLLHRGQLGQLLSAGCLRMFAEQVVTCDAVNTRVSEAMSATPASEITTVGRVGVLFHSTNFQALSVR